VDGSLKKECHSPTILKIEDFLQRSADLLGMSQIPCIQTLIHAVIDCRQNPKMIEQRLKEERTMR